MSDEKPPARWSNEKIDGAAEPITRETLDRLYLSVSKMGLDKWGYAACVNCGRGFWFQGFVVACPYCNKAPFQVII